MAAALEALASLVALDVRPVPQPEQRPALPGSAGAAGDSPGADAVLTAENAAAVIGALLPEGAIVSDEANTSGLWLPGATAGAPPHDWLTLTGGAIGQGLPVATGAAVACPDRPVLALEADGSAMYTISALWTHAREGLDVTTIIFSNRAYAILNLELQRVGATADSGTGIGEAARSLLDLARPAGLRPLGSSLSSCAGPWPGRARTSSRPSSRRSRSATVRQRYWPPAPPADDQELSPLDDQPMDPVTATPTG